VLIFVDIKKQKKKLDLFTNIRSTKMQVCRLDIESSHRANAEELDDDSECNDPAPRCNPPKHEDLISSLALLIESLIPPGVSKHTAVSSTSGSPSGTTTRRAGPANFKC
jgi:hypothetical protein